MPSGLAIPHPFFFCAMAAIALGVAIYTIVKDRPRPVRARGRQRSSSPPPRPPSPPPKPSYYKPPKPKPDSRRSTPTSDESSECRRRRPDNNSASSDQISNRTEVKRNDERPSNDVNDSGKTSNMVYTKNIDEESYVKNVYEKLTDDAVPQSTVRNISSDYSDSENNDAEMPDAATVDVPNDLSHDDDSYDSELIYKAYVHDNLVNEIKSSGGKRAIVTTTVDNHHLEIVAQDGQEMIGAFGGTSHAVQCQERVNEMGDTEKEILVSMETGICAACNENPINAIAVPCLHSYLCSDCAGRFMNLHKNKCCICGQIIRQFTNRKS